MIRVMIFNAEAQRRGGAENFSASLHLGASALKRLAHLQRKPSVKHLSVFLVVFVWLAGCVAPPPPEATGPRLLLATTTSTRDSGLLDDLLPDFEKEYGVAVDVVAVGTGQALKLGEDGNADVLLVHARAQEDAFLAGGHGVAP